MRGVRGSVCVCVYVCMRLRRPYLVEIHQYAHEVVVRVDKTGLAVSQHIQLSFHESGSQSVGSER